MEGNVEYEIWSEYTRVKRAGSLYVRARFTSTKISNIKPLLDNEQSTNNLFKLIKRKPATPKQTNNEAYAFSI